jgi:hypothetical protein
LVVGEPDVDPVAGAHDLGCDADPGRLLDGGTNGHLGVDDVLFDDLVVAVDQVRGHSPVAPDYPRIVKPELQRHGQRTHQRPPCRQHDVVARGTHGARGVAHGGCDGVPGAGQGAVDVARDKRWPREVDVPRGLLRRR